MPESKPLWHPTEQFIHQSNLHAFRKWLAERNIEPGDYESLWEWSVRNPDEFWKSVYDYFKVIDHGAPSSILNGSMPDCTWFEGSKVNYAEHIFRNATDAYPAILFASERHPLKEISWKKMGHQVSCLQRYFIAKGIRAGDRIAAYVPNIPEATCSFLAAASVGAVWSSCSPDFGPESVIDRFSQIEPKVLICVDGYQYGGKQFDKIPVIKQILDSIPSIKHVILIPYLSTEIQAEVLPNAELMPVICHGEGGMLEFEPVPFEHPLWVLYSSGTTGIPKAITHGHGGMLLEHLKYLAFHNDVHPGERFFWFTTTGWMMWNFVQGALLHGASIVLYDGSPGYPDLNVLWKLAQDAGIQHFGTSAPFLVACMKANLDPHSICDLSRLRSVSSTGAPLPAEAFDWVYDHVHHHLWLCSMSGGTDVCTAFVGGCPEKDVIRGEIQCRGLGCDLHAFNAKGDSVIEEVGEMVITTPMPCMPVYFWNDPGKERYRKSYFSAFPNVWHHGDWVYITRNGGLIISGRSDTTLNRQGIRIGTAEIYRALNDIEEVEDSLIVHLDHKGQDLMPLFVVLKKGLSLSDELKTRIRTTLRNKCSPRHVPDEIFQVQEIPYTLSGKKMEAPVKKVLSGESIENIASRDAMRNPSALDAFVRMEEKLRSSQ
jgi:acetoacetyl-CoA synthetase